MSISDFSADTVIGLDSPDEPVSGVAEEHGWSSLKERVSLVEAGAARRSYDSLGAVRQRLRILCGILLVGFTVFFLRQLLVGGFLPEMRWAWATVIGSLGIAAGFLTVPRTVTRVWVAIAQSLIFGGTACFFAAAIHFSVKHNLEPRLLPWATFELMFETAWFCLIAFTYAVLFFGSLRQVAWVVSVLVAIPAAVMLYDRFQFPAFAEVVNLNMVSLILMTLAACDVAILFLGHRFQQLQQEAAVGRRFGQYQLKRRIGSGGMGEVFLAEHLLLKRPCALKRIRAEHVTDPVTLARFEREVRATAEIPHPHIVEIYDYGRTRDGTFYYVMEYLRGLCLQDLVYRHGPMPAARLVFLLAQVCEALDEAHSAGLIHRDVKPGNIFVAHRARRYDFVKLLDFGLVKAADPGDGALSLADNAVGSPLYMPPERFAGDKPDARGDVYSLGAVAYYLAGGRPPFVGKNASQIMRGHVNQPVPPLSQFGREIPADVEELIMRCLAKRPEQRFQSASALGEALATCSVAGRWTRQDAAQWWQSNAGIDLTLMPGPPAPK